MTPPEKIRIAELEARVHALEAALARRSDELRRLQRHLSKRDLIALARLSEGLLPLPLRAYEPALWRETTGLEEASVEDVLLDLWRSLYPERSERSERSERPSGSEEPT